MKNKQFIILIFLVFITPNLWANNITSPILQISAGHDYTLALTNDGTVWAWGKNDHGQLGDGTTINKGFPVQVKNIIDVKYIATGDAHNLALKKDGTVWAWGKNDYGQIGDGTTTDRKTPVEITGINNVKSISAGDFHSFALKEDSTVWGWGCNRFQKLGAHDPVRNMSYSSTPVKITHCTNNVILLSAGSEHNLALKEDGTVWAVGNNKYGQIGSSEHISWSRVDGFAQTTGIDNVKLLSAGYEYNLALKEDGTVWSWGLNNYGQLGDGTTSNRNTPVQVTGLDNVKFISANLYNSVALKEDGTVWVWGLVDGILSTKKTTPVQVANLVNIKSLSMRYNHGFALKEDRSLWVWGANNDKCITYHYQTDTIITPIPFCYLIINSHPDPNKWFISNTIDIKILFESSKPYGFYYHNINNEEDTQISITNSTYQTKPTMTISDVNATAHGSHYFHFSIANSAYIPIKTHHIQYNQFDQKLTLECTTHPDPNEFYLLHDTTINITNSKPGISFRYTWDKNPTTIPNASSLTNNTGQFSNSFRYPGIYYFHVRAEDSLGNIAPGNLTTHHRINIFPKVPYIQSITHPKQNEFYTLPNVAIEYIHPKGDMNFRYIVDNQPLTIPDESATLQTSSSFVLPGKTPGTYYIHIRAEYSNGDLDPTYLTAHFRYNIIASGETPPTILPIIDNLKVTPTVVSNTESITIQADVILND